MIYLLHFERPLGNPANRRALAQHYLGWASDLSARLAEHAAGQGAAITRAAVARGISWEAFDLGPGDYRLEKRLKRLKATPRLCPICGRSHPGGRLLVPVLAEQLVLPFDFDPFDVDVPRRGPDWYEVSYFRGASAPRWPVIAGETYDIPF